MRIAVDDLVWVYTNPYNTGLSRRYGLVSTAIAGRHAASARPSR
jgi:hypothetical protein